MGEFIEGFDTLASVGKRHDLRICARLSGISALTPAEKVAGSLRKQDSQIIAPSRPGKPTEAANKGAHRAGGRSIGCNIEHSISSREQPSRRYARELPLLLRPENVSTEYSVATSVSPGGLDTDQLFEASSLIETGKIYQFPVILFRRRYWAGLLRWLQAERSSPSERSRRVHDPTILTDDPAEAAQARKSLEYHMQHRIAGLRTDV